jgi:hypothetical protein
MLPNGIDSVEHPNEASESGITIRCFTPIGTIPGMGRVEIEAKEFINLEAHDVHQFVVLRVTPSAEYAQPGNALISYEDVDKIVSAIDQLAGVNPASTKYKQIEVEFSLKPNFKIVVFNDAKGKLMFSVSAEQATAYFGDLHRMTDFRSLILRAKSTIDQNRSHRQS